MKAMKFEAEEMVCTNPAELPEESRFLLEMDGVNNSKNVLLIMTRITGWGQ